MTASFDPAESTDCDREPIHQIGSVQSFGGLIALDQHWRITHLSDNCGDLLGLGALPEITSNLTDHLLADAAEQLRTAAGRISADKRVEQIFGLKLRENAGQFDCAIHASAAGLILEFEQHLQSYEDQLKLIGPMIARLSDVSDLPKLCNIAVTAVRELAGYDRVMVYKFRRDDSGEVIAESAAEDMQPYLGLRYPKEDIPLPARAMFLRNRVRVIEDINAKTSQIRGDDSTRPLDLTHSMLRASAPVHLQYLSNMGVAASLTIGIIRQGKLWGLISCHHRSPRLPPYALRTVVEMFSQVFSLMLDRILVDASARLRNRARQLHNEMVQRFSGDTSLVNDLPALDDILSSTIDHDGISIWMDGNYRANGKAPSDKQFLSLLPELSARPTSELFAVGNLSAHISAAEEFADEVTGALALPISREPRNYLVLWREPLAQSVRWGGEPAKVYTPGTTRLEPRSSFAAWTQTVEGQAEDWSDDELLVAEELRLTLIEVVLHMADEIAQERKRSQEQQELLIAELNHRVRNILNLIRSLVMQSQGEAVSVANFAEIIGGRIAALASAHDNITRERWSSAPLLNLFESEFAAYVTGDEARYQVTGDDVLIKPEAFTVLALVVHELVTNSVKYGALSITTGSIFVTIEKSQDDGLKMSWTEQGGPLVEPPTRRSFGSIIIERSIPFELRGEADMHFEPDGVEAHFSVPARYVQWEARGELSGEGPQQGTKTKVLSERNSATPRRAGAAVPEQVLVVEDNMLIAMSNEDSLNELGVSNVIVQSTVAGALESIALNPPDFAIIDYELGDESCLTITQELSSRAIEFALATGYSEMVQEAKELGAAAMIQKPYGTEEIAEALASYSSN